MNTRWLSALLLATVCLRSDAQPADDLKAPPGTPPLIEGRLPTPSSPPVEHITRDPAEALVAVEVTSVTSQGKVTRRANGVLVRCDGYILAPCETFAYVYDPADGRRCLQTISIVLHPGTKDARRYEAFPPHITTLRLGISLARIKGLHAPCLRLLAPDTLKPGDEAEVYFARFDEKARAYLPIERRRARLGALPNRPDENHPGDWPLEEGVGDVPVGALVVGPESLGIGVMAGHGRASNRDRMVSMANLGSVTIAVAALPTTDAEYERRSRRKGALRPEETGLRSGSLREVPDLPQAAGPDVGAPPSSAAPAEEPPPGPGGRGAPALPPAEGAGPEAPSTDQDSGRTPSPPADEQRLPVAREKGFGTARPLRRLTGSELPDDVGTGAMVDIPGGTVLLPEVLQRPRKDREWETIVCIPPFQMDRYEVTNAEYLEFWQSLSESDRADARVRADLWPLGWAVEGDPFPQEIAHAPVLGVSLAGAQAYARFRGKRLPTPYEWVRAAYGEGGEADVPEWVREYIQDRRDTYDQARLLHADYWRQFGPFTFQEYGPDFSKIPWMAPTPGEQLMAVFSRETVLALTAPLWRKWVDPCYVVEAGSRPFDISPFGVCDMILNAEEYVQPNPEGNQAFVGGPLMRVRWTWDLSVLPPSRNPVLSANPLTPSLGVNMRDRPGDSRYLDWFWYACPGRWCVLKYNANQPDPTEADKMLFALANYWEECGMINPLRGCRLELAQPVMRLQFLDLDPSFRWYLDNPPSYRDNYLGSPVVSSTVPLWQADPSLYVAVSLWSYPLKHYRREIGRPLAIDLTDPMRIANTVVTVQLERGSQIDRTVYNRVHPLNQGAFYVPPYGFRCAR